MHLISLCQYCWPFSLLCHSAVVTYQVVLSVYLEVYAEKDGYSTVASSTLHSEQEIICMYVRASTRILGGGEGRNITH